MPMNAAGTVSAVVSESDGSYASLENAATTGNLYWGLSVDDMYYASGVIGSPEAIWTGDQSGMGPRRPDLRAAETDAVVNCDRVPYCTIPINNINGGLYYPSIDGPNVCKEVARQNKEKPSTTGITYFVCSSGPCSPSSPYLIKGVDLGVKIKARGWTGWHCHDSPTRPTVTPDSAAGNSGQSGLGFGFTHHWPDVAGAVNVVFYSRSDTLQFNNDQQDTSFIYCIGVGSLYELGLGNGYVLLGGDTPHPKNHFVVFGMLDALKDLAKDVLAVMPGASPLWYNDASLPAGGLFDWNYGSPDWTSPHCSHRTGNQIDLDLHPGYSDDTLNKLEVLCKKNGFHVYRENAVHWHITYLYPRAN